MENSSEKKINQYAFAFYNLENLFDTKNDPDILDDDFTPTSSKKWNEKRLQKKIQDLGKIIEQIGCEETSYPPVIVGVSEVENAAVLSELVASEYLKNKGYDFIHFDSPDERGIDTAMLYRTKYFTVTHSEAITLHLVNEDGVRDYTRDILHIEGDLEKEKVHILINHWPSRRAGNQKTSKKRIAAAEKNKTIIAKIQEENPDAKVIVMGDFNDNPQNESVQHLVGNTLYNPMELLHTQVSGSLSYKGDWNLFDQILFSNNFLQQHGNTFRFKRAQIFDPDSLKDYYGASKGTPFRTYVGRKYIGGFSDHFPVYATFNVHPK
jgi:endonuclease/exonuclease/phosphatase family metal-dependent hydrolase